MKPFRLLGLQRLRQLEADQAAAELARRTRERQRAERRARQALEALSGNQLSDGDVASWRASVAARVALTADLRSADDAMETSSEREREAHGAWASARQRARTLERLAERHEEAFDSERERAEQRTLDELATQRAARPDDPGGGAR